MKAKLTRQSTTESSQIILPFSLNHCDKLLNKTHCKLNGIVISESVNVLVVTRRLACSPHMELRKVNTNYYSQV